MYAYTCLQYFIEGTRGHGKAVDFIKQFDLPLLLVGGGGYTIRNVARCWCYETAVALGVEVANELPYNDYFEYYGPDFKLNISPSNMANHNNPEFLEKIKTRIFEHLRMLPHAPGVQMAEIPEDAIDESDNEDTHEDTNKHRDRRVSICASDKRIHRDDEFYDSDDEYPTGGATDMDRDRHKHKHKRPRTETEKNTEHSTEMKDVKTDQKLSETRDTGETSETSKEQEQREEKSTESTDKKDTGDTTKDTLPPEMSDPSKTTDEQEKMDH